MTEPGLQFIWHPNNIFISRFGFVLILIPKTTIDCIIKNPYYPIYSQNRGIIEIMDYVLIYVRKQIRQKRKGICAS